MDKGEAEAFVKRLEEKARITRLHASELYGLAQTCERLAYELNNEELIEISKRLWNSVKVAESLSL